MLPRPSFSFLVVFLVSNCESLQLHCLKRQVCGLHIKDPKRSEKIGTLHDLKLMLSQDDKATSCGELPRVKCTVHILYIIRQQNVR